MLLLCVALAGCAFEIPVERRIARADPAVVVEALAETSPVGTAADDAADDPAIWRNEAVPSASLIVGTDKKAGLYVYGLDGRTRSFLNAGRVNNVDLRNNVPIGEKPQILVVASNRDETASASLALFTLDPTTATLTPVAKLPAGPGEAYGLCLRRAADGIDAFLVVKDGTIRQFRLNLSGRLPSATLLRTLKLASQAEGCAVDESTDRLYVGEERRGLWRFDAKPQGSGTGTLVARADGRRLVADVEGVAVADNHLIVSSQGDNAYSVWRLPEERYVGRFRIGPGRLGATEETDGIELVAGHFGSHYPAGLFAAQDGINSPAAQNFKFVSWADILQKLQSRTPRQ
jgi:3-phytase